MSEAPMILTPVCERFRFGLERGVNRPGNVLFQYLIPKRLIYFIRLCGKSKVIFANYCFDHLNKGKQSNPCMLTYHLGLLSKPVSPDIGMTKVQNHSIFLYSISPFIYKKNPRDWKSAEVTGKSELVMEILKS